MIDGGLTLLNALEINTLPQKKALSLEVRLNYKLALNRAALIKHGFGCTGVKLTP